MTLTFTSFLQLRNNPWFFSWHRSLQILRQAPHTLFFFFYVVSSIQILSHLGLFLNNTWSITIMVRHVHFIILQLFWRFYFRDGYLQFRYMIRSWPSFAVRWVHVVVNYFINVNIRFNHKFCIINTAHSLSWTHFWLHIIFAAVKIFLVKPLFSYVILLGNLRIELLINGELGFGCLVSVREKFSLEIVIVSRLVLILFNMDKVQISFVWEAEHTIKLVTHAPVQGLAFKLIFIV